MPRDEVKFNDYVTKITQYRKPPDFDEGEVAAAVVVLQQRANWLSSPAAPRTDDDEELEAVTRLPTDSSLTIVTEDAYPASKVLTSIVLNASGSDEDGDQVFATRYDSEAQRDGTVLFWPSGTPKPTWVPPPPESENVETGWVPATPTSTPAPAPPPSPAPPPAVEPEPEARWVDVRPAARPQATPTTTAPVAFTDALADAEWGPRFEAYLTKYDYAGVLGFYRHITTGWEPAQTWEWAQFLFDQYVSRSSATPVQLTAQAQRAVQMALADHASDPKRSPWPAATMFDTAKQELATMLSSAYNSFKGGG